MSAVAQDERRAPTSDGTSLFLRRWQPGADAERRGVLHVAHGLAEHGERYGRFAAALAAAGYVVYAADHRGHGKTIERAEDLGYVDVGGFERSAQDLREILAWERAQHPGLPHFLFAHSYGTLLGQAAITPPEVPLAGVILSGPSGKPTPLAHLGRLVARLERARLGARSASARMTALTFESFNRRFRPNRTTADWLSRDPAEVDAYVADPLCGFDVSTQLWIEVLDGAAAVSKRRRQEMIPKELPVLVIAGSEDPVGADGKGPRGLADAYRRLGLRDVTCTLYPGARHELLNETNRAEVTADVLRWLDAHVPTNRPDRG